MLQQLSSDVRQYLLVTGNYWAFTLTDGALRMLVVLHFYQLGYSPLAIALLFLFYEFFGVITNLIGGWFATRIGLNNTMNIGLAIQIIALSTLLVPTSALSIGWVMLAQALSGIAKDLNKMSAKSAIKLLVPTDRFKEQETQNTLYHWIALLTGSKNALKGLGFFMGGGLLSWLGFRGGILFMAVALTFVLFISLLKLKHNLGKTTFKVKWRNLFSKSQTINHLSAARLFLFGARDIWFVVALPVYLANQLRWEHWFIGSFLAAWIIGYGIIQSLTPRFTQGKAQKNPDGSSAFFWALTLTIIPVGIAIGLISEFNPSWVLITGLLVFGVVFAINSSLHSYLIVHYARSEGVALDIGFYYMANAMGRLLGTVLSGWVYQNYGLSACLLISSVFLVLTTVISLRLPRNNY